MIVRIFLLSALVMGLLATPVLGASGATKPGIGRGDGPPVLAGFKPPKSQPRRSPCIVPGLC